MAKYSIYNAFTQRCPQSAMIVFVYLSKLLAMHMHAHSHRQTHTHTHTQTHFSISKVTFFIWL